MASIAINVEKTVFKNYGVDTTLSDNGILKSSKYRPLRLETSPFSHIQIRVLEDLEGWTRDPQIVLSLTEGSSAIERLAQRGINVISNGSSEYTFSTIDKVQTVWNVLKEQGIFAPLHVSIWDGIILGRRADLSPPLLELDDGLSPLPPARLALQPISDIDRVAFPADKVIFEHIDESKCNRLPRDDVNWHRKPTNDSTNLMVFLSQKPDAFFSALHVWAYDVTDDDFGKIALTLFWKENPQVVQYLSECNMAPENYQNPIISPRHSQFYSGMHSYTYRGDALKKIGYMIASNCDIPENYYNRLQEYINAGSLMPSSVEPNSSSTPSSFSSPKAVGGGSYPTPLKKKQKLDTGQEVHTQSSSRGSKEFVYAASQGQTQ